MPEISRFHGIVIRRYWDDHNPPHFHAEYSGQEARIEINRGGVLSGRLPPRAQGLVTERTTLHRQELLDLWKRAQSLQPLHGIDPLPWATMPAHPAGPCGPQEG